MKPRLQLSRFQAISFRRLLRISVAVGIVWIAIAPGRLPAQRNESEARSFVGSVAAGIYALAWPTATFDDVSIRPIRQVSQGFDVPIRLNGRSGWDGSYLWLELVLNFRNGDLYDFRLGQHNGNWPPFLTAALAVEGIRTMAEENKRQMLVGTWRDQNSRYTFSSDGRWWCEWDNGDVAEGNWTLRNDTLTWIFANGNRNRLILEYVDPNENRTRSLADGVLWTARRIR